jgi:CRP-like cAMP-binding protein
MLCCDISHNIYLRGMKNDCEKCAFKSRAAEKLGGDHLTSLSCNSVLVKFRKGDSIIRQGTLSTNVVYLRNGLAKLHITGPYHEQIIRINKAPCYLGLPTTIGDKVNQYSVTAIGDAEVCFIDMDAFRLLLRENDSFSYEIILELCRNELESMRRCSKRTQKQSRGNIADVLLELADVIYQSDNFILPVSQAEIGNLVDTSRESVSRILAEFQKDGIIDIEGKRIEIINKKSLSLISQNG